MIAEELLFFMLGVIAGILFYITKILYDIREELKK